MMNDYSIPDEDPFVITADENPDMPCPENLRRLVFFIKARKVFMPLDMSGGHKAYLCAAHDAIPLFTMNDDDTKFVSTDWVINENLMGKPEFNEQLKKIISTIWESEQLKEYL